jgi:transcriptional regulator with XRE-family HTH domain
MVGAGVRLRAIRRRWGLSLREVEQRSRRMARGWGDSSFQVSASWLSRLESDEKKLTVKKLIALAEIYSISPDQLTRLFYPRSEDSLILDQLSSPNATKGTPDSPGKRLRPATPFPVRSADETTVFPTGNAGSARYLRGIIGKLDLTLDPMIPAGSMVKIDTTMREISPKKNWTHEFQRPIYFLKTKDGYVCGWCELDENSQWLTLIPHPQSAAPSQRWMYSTEVQNLGRVVSVVIRRENGLSRSM